MTRSEMPGAVIADEDASSGAPVLLEEALTRRFSCRAFRPMAVDRSIIEYILDLAQHSPSWCNTQPWLVDVTTGDATERLRSGLRSFAATQPPATDVPFPERYVGDSLTRRRALGLKLYAATGIERGDRAASAALAARNFELFGAPHVAIITAERALGAYGLVDCGAYIAHFLLAAHSVGVSTIALASIARCSPLIRQQLGVDDGRQVLCGIAFGYCDDQAAANSFRAERAPIADAVRWVEG